MWRAAVVALAVALVPATAEARVSRTRAASIAARALHVHSVPGAVRLEVSARALPAGAHLDQAGPDGRRPRSTTLRGGSLVTRLTHRRIGRRAWLVWEDLAPTAQWAHPGVLALVDVRTGHVFGRRRVQWEPLVGGRAPGMVVIFEHLPATSAVQPTARAAAATPGLNASCIVAAGDVGEPLTKPDFDRLRNFAAGSVGPQNFALANSALGIHQAIEDAYARGCRDLLLYLNGHQGTDGAGHPYVSLESEHVFYQHETVKHRVLTAQQLRGDLLTERGKYPDLGVTVVVEACYSGNWVQAVNPPGKTPAANAVFTSVNATQPSVGPPDPGGTQPSPFMDALTIGAAGWLAQHPDATFGQAIGAIAGAVAHTADVVARGLSGNRYPQTGQYAAAQEVTGQVLPPAPASSAPAAPDASCEVHVAYDGRCTRSGQIAVRVSLAFPGGGEGTVDIAPGGGSEDSEAPPPGTGNPYFHDVFFFAPLGATVTLTASPKGGSRWNGWDPIATEHNQGCPQTGPGSPTTCSVTLPATWTARIGYEITAVPDFAKSP